MPLLLFISTPVISDQGSTLRTSLNLSPSLKALSPGQSHGVGDKASTYEFSGRTI